MSICPGSPTSGPCVARAVCHERELCALMRYRPVDLIGETYKPLTHFVGFRGEELSRRHTTTTTAIKTTIRRQGSGLEIRRMR